VGTGRFGRGRNANTEKRLWVFTQSRLNGLLGVGFEEGEKAPRKAERLEVETLNQSAESSLRVVDNLPRDDEKGDHRPDHQP